MDIKLEDIANIQHHGSIDLKKLDEVENLIAILRLAATAPETENEFDFDGHVRTSPVVPANPRTGTYRARDTPIRSTDDPTAAVMIQVNVVLPADNPMIKSLLKG